MEQFVRSTSRRSADPEYAFNDINIGFRCVRSPNTPVNQPMETNIPASTSVAPVIGSIQQSQKDDALLVYVPAGEFTMGSLDGYGNAEPVHAVYLDAFWIDQTEVTNKQYAACVSGEGCTLPSNTGSATRSSYYGNPEFDDYPVIYVDWSQADAYCAWAGRKLPTEAQWEKAANGADPRIYPWDDPQNKDLLNNSSSDTTKAGSYEIGKSSYGGYDMAGNVWEWVNDWYDDAYYQVSPYLNPLGPDVGQYRVLRGGSWNVNTTSAAVPFRFRSAPEITDSYYGFRCASPAP
jgi:serine/threonine-protein kinase